MKKTLDLDHSFPRAASYRAWMTPGASRVCDHGSARAPEPFTERHIQCVWADTRLRPAALHSHQGEAVMVSHPGRWNLEAGPDFLDAVLLVGPERRRVQGDVEIHIRPGDWAAHRHDKDNRYRRVIAHVCYHGGSLPSESLPPGAIQLSLGTSLATDPAFSFESIDTTAYPYAVTDTIAPPCAAILHGWHPDRREALLDAAGEERLRLKVARMSKAIEVGHPEQCLYEALMAALGYKRNQAPFRELAARVPLDELQPLAEGSATKAYAILLGVSGLLPTRESPMDDEARQFLRELWDGWWRHQSHWYDRTMHASSWRLDGLRPQNHPVRRLAAAGALVTAMPTWLRDLRAQDTRQARRWFDTTAANVKRLTCMPFWEHRLTFTGKVSDGSIALLGSPRIAALVSNVVVPFLAATGSDVSALVPQLPPEQDNALIRQTAFSLFGQDHNPAMYHTGLRQQGLLQIFHDFCLTARHGCPECELVAALKEQ